MGRQRAVFERESSKSTSVSGIDATTREANGPRSTTWWSFEPRISDTTEEVSRKTVRDDIV